MTMVCCWTTCLKTLIDDLAEKSIKIGIKLNAPIPIRPNDLDSCQLCLQEASG
jgi:hypothetical protein